MTRLRIALLAMLTIFGGVALLAVTQTADAQQPADEPTLIVEIRNADYGDQALTNFWWSWVGLGDYGERSQWEAIPLGDDVYAVRNVGTGRYLRSRGTWGVGTSRARVDQLGSRYQWTLESNDDGTARIVNVRAGRYLDADRSWFGYSIDLNRRAARGTNWTVTIVGGPPPTPTVIPTPLPTSTVVPTPLPTSTVVPTPLPTSTVVPTPLPTATVTPTATATATPTPEPPLGDLQDVTGRVVDAVAASNGNVLPVVGATIKVGLLETTTGNDGTFSLDDVPVGVNNFEINGSTALPAPDGQPYTDYHNAVRIEATPGVLDLGTYNSTPLTPFSTTIDPTQTTMVGNPELEALVAGSTVELEVPAGSAVVAATGELFDGDLSITQVPNCCTPSSMPQFVIDANPLIVTVQPLGVSFDPPAPLSLPNTLGYAPGTRVDLWSLNPETGTFEVKGVGQVSADGTTIETVSGGLVMTDWHFFIPPPPVAGQPFWNFSLSTFQTVAADQPVSLDISSAFTDPDGDLLTYSITSDGGWGATIDLLNGVVSGPAIEDGGRRTITVQASDGVLTSSRSITIQATLRPIYIGPTRFDVPNDGQLTIDFSELYISPDGSPMTYELQNGIESPPEPSATLDPTGVFTIDANNLQFGFFDFSVDATNDSGTTSPYLTLNLPQIEG